MGGRSILCGSLFALATTCSALALAQPGAGAPSAGQPAQSAAALSVLREGDALGCPGHSQLKNRVEALLERPFSAATRDPVSLLVHFRRTSSGLEAVVTMTGSRSGWRQIRTDAQPGSAGECEELGDAAALAISMLLDPTFLPPVEPEPPEEPPESPYDQMNPYPEQPESAPEPKPDAAAAGRRRPLETPDWTVGAGPAESDGLVGGQVFGFQLQLGVFLGDNTRVGVFGRRFATATHALGEGEVDVDLWQLGAEACYFGGERPLQLGVCAAFVGGGIRGEAFDFLEATSASHSWFGGEAGVAGLWSFAPGLWLGGDLRLVVPLNDDEFVVRGVGELTPGNRVAQTAQISLGVRFE